jgi:hypothetical protein
VRQTVDLPGNGSLLHLRAGQRYDLTEEVDAEIPMS